MVWYDTNYSYKKKITIDRTKVSGDEIDFPVLISVTDNDLRDEANGGHTKSANGYDIIFTNSAENTQLKHEIEKYTNTNGLLVFWVKVPALSSVFNTDIYIYYGKAGVGADPSTTDTWDSNFMAVWHMNSLLDSTSNNIDLTNVGADSGQVGKIGDCYGFVNANSDYMYHATFLDVMPVSDELTFETWAYHDSDPGEHQTYCSKDSRAGQDHFVFRRLLDNDFLQMFAEANNGGNKHATDTVATTDAAWHYQVGVIKAIAALNIFRDTNKTIGDFIGGFVDGTDNNFEIGRWHFRDVEHMDGDLEEFRVSDKVRSDNWINTTFETQNDPSSFMSFGSEQSIIPSCDGQSFSLYGTSTTILFPYPEWGTPNNRIDKTIDLLDFWDNDLDTIDKGISSQPLTLSGTLCKCGTGDWEDYTAISTWLDSIKTAMNNGEEFEINELGSCINGVYVISNFTFDTIKKSKNCYAWSLNLERVRDV